jgi:hypothetical protein
MLYRNKRILEIARNFPCQHCGKQDGTVVAAHSNQLRDGKGKGIKSSDAAIAALCYNCHMIVDQSSKLSKQEKMTMWEDAHRLTIRKLIEGEWLIVNDRKL